VLPIAIGLVLVPLTALASLRWPMVTQALFVALIPIEQVVVIHGLGTISRFVGVLFAVTYAGPRIGRLTLAAMPPAAWAFVAWAVVSLLWALDPGTAWAEIPTLLQLFAIALLVADVVIQKPAMVRSLLWVYSLSAAATAVIGIQTFIALGPAGEARAAAIQNQNPAQFAAVLLPALVFGVYELLNGERRIVGGAITLITTAGVLVSGTRGAWLSVAIVALLFILPRLSPRRLISATALVAVIVVVTLQLPGVSSLVLQRVQTALTTGGAGRTDIWTVAVTSYGTAPLLGVGYANFPVAYTRDAVVTPNLTPAAANLPPTLGPHNLAVGTLIELGPIGLALLAIFLLPLVLRRGWGPDAATVQAALASLLILALFLDILSNRKQVWLVIGFVAGLAYLRRTAAKPEREPSATMTAPAVSPGARAGDRPQPTGDA
jgi:O-antigen ligase